MLLASLVKRLFFYLEAYRIVSNGAHTINLCEAFNYFLTHVATQDNYLRSISKQQRNSICTEMGIFQTPSRAPIIYTRTRANINILTRPVICCSPKTCAKCFSRTFSVCRANALQGLPARHSAGRVCSI